MRMNVLDMSKSMGVLANQLGLNVVVGAKRYSTGYTNSLPA